MDDLGGAVYLVGAGPGAVDLITVRGAEILRRAEVVIYDSLVNPGLLRLAPIDAELVHVGKRAGDVDVVSQNDLNALLIERARNGKRVVRLKGGDPFIFGRGGEEAAALAAAGIRFEVVPGVTSAIAAPAYAGIPLTHRDYGSFVAFITGHEDGNKGADASVPWEELARAAKDRGTLVLMMATAQLANIVKRLTSAGLSRDTPAAAIQWGTLASQKSVLTTLERLARVAEDAKLGAPAVIVVGRCAKLRESLAWAESMPLFGRRIVVTRASEKISILGDALRTRGAEVIEFPTIEMIEPTNWSVLDEAIARLDSFNWIIFTSATGVDRFIARLAHVGKDIRALASAKIAAIGPATASRLREFALCIDVVPSEYRAEMIVDCIGPAAIKGARFLIPRAEVAREVMPEMLRAAGASEVVVAPSYRTVMPSSAAVDRVREMIKAAPVDLVAFTSSSTASNYVEMVGAPHPGAKAAAIGPITGATARRLGFDVVANPKEYTVPALAQAISDYFTSIR
ncbi:MAG TPA: uroporphyrinogen-III C-methyltransferase [Candidatus Binataceae bacterium]|nr:uroporphyrinogen-III C-methyltransferase [Candidatus Binataceae bacterium]